MTPPTPEETLRRAREARVSRALAEGEAMQWTKTAAGWRVETASGGRYEVSGQGCSCPDHVYRCAGTNRKCKHAIALALHLVQKGLL
jgi:hypothetical protein